MYSDEKVKELFEIIVKGEVRKPEYELEKDDILLIYDDNEIENYINETFNEIENNIEKDKKELKLKKDKLERFKMMEEKYNNRDEIQDEGLINSLQKIVEKIPELEREISGMEHQMEYSTINTFTIYDLITYTINNRKIHALEFGYHGQKISLQRFTETKSTNNQLKMILDYEQLNNNYLNNL